MIPPVDVVVVGESMGCLRGDGSLRLGGSMQVTVAGAESNVAIGLCRLGHTARWVSRVGDDEVGQLVLRTLRAELVDVTCALVDPDAPTGLMLLEHRTADHLRVTYHRSGSAASRLVSADVDAAIAAGARLLHITGITPALSPSAPAAVQSAVERARAAGWQVSLDVNYRSLLWDRTAAARALRPLLGYVSIVFASEAELGILTDDRQDPVVALLAGGVEQVVVTYGGNGAAAAVGERRWSRSAAPATVVDTVGAGDAFAAGYLSGLLDGLPVPERLDRGAQVAAFAVATRGDWEGLPSRAELSLALSESDGTWR